MNLSLSKGGRPASVKNRAWHYCQMAWRGMCHQKTLSRLAAFSPLLLLGMGQMAHATDLLAGGKDDVKATFGADSPACRPAVTDRHSLLMMHRRRCAWHRRTRRVGW